METSAEAIKYANELKKARTRSFILGAVTGGVIVAAVKDKQGSLKEITTALVSVATSYYGCKFLYELFS